MCSPHLQPCVIVDHALWSAPVLKFVKVRLEVVMVEQLTKQVAISKVLFHSKA